MKRELEERCNEVTKDLLGSLKNLKKEKKENEKNDKNESVKPAENNPYRLFSHG